MYRGGGSRMPSVGTGSVDIRSILSSILNVVKSRANAICTAPCDGAILKMHYRWTFFMLIGGFFTVWYQWYNRDVITCVSHYNADTQVRLDYINVCLSYPYVEVVDEEGNTTKRYLLFYRWVQWSFLVLAGIYYIPRKISKNMENPKAKKLIEDLAANASRYENAEHILLEKVYMYMINNLKTHNGLYMKYLTLNVIALAVDIGAFHYFDFLLQGRFITYGFEAYPFERDPEYFTDYISQTFPPFALCTLTIQNALVGKRTEIFGCHLTIMELYEKVFLFIWLWLIILITMTALYIVILLLAMIPKFRELWLRTAKPINGTEKTNVLISKVNKNCRIGDIYLLYRFKSHLSHAKFYELMIRLSDPNINMKNREQTVIDAKPPPSKQTQMMPHHNNPSAPHPDSRHRKPQQHSITPPMNPDYISQIYGNPETLARHGQVSQNDVAQRTPLLNKNNTNTSILIE
uniref:Innexin n=1 Tax=Hirondellea gigas TaxID=1518452 RepID=A0A6A7FVA8_9CRUS